MHQHNYDAALFHKLFSFPSYIFDVPFVVSLFIMWNVIMTCVTRSQKKGTDYSCFEKSFKAGFSASRRMGKSKRVKFKLVRPERKVDTSFSIFLR